MLKYKYRRYKQMGNTVVIIGQSEYLSTLPVHLVTSVIQELVAMGYLSVPETDSAFVNRLMKMGYRQLEAENIYLKYKAADSLDELDEYLTIRELGGCYELSRCNTTDAI